MLTVHSETMAQDMTLLWGSGSPPCWRVMITLEEKNLQGYNSKLLSFEKAEHKSQEVLDINPRGQVGCCLNLNLTCQIVKWRIPLPKITL